MGFWGRFLVGRALPECAVLRAYGPLEVPPQALGDGWWQVRYHRDGPSTGAIFQALAVETEAPVLSAYVLDSDCADVVGVTPSGRHWRAYLHEDTAEEYGAPALTHPPDELLRQVLEWAAKAELAPDPQAVAAALGARHTFVGETWAGLLAALGIAAPVSDSSADPAGASEA